MSKRGNGEGTIYQKVIKRKLKDGTEKEYKTWECQITVGYDNTGKVIRKSISGKSRKEVAEKLKAELYAQQQNSLVQRDKVTFSEYLERWLETKAVEGKKRSTLTGYKTYIDLHIAPALGGYCVQKITPSLINSFYAKKCKEVDNTNTVHRFHAIIHNALKYAVQEGVIPNNPSDNAKLPKKTKYVSDVLTVEEVKLLLETAACYGITKDGKRSANHNQSMYPAIATMIFTGMRRGEVLGLKWKHVNLDNSFSAISVAETLLETNDGIIVDTPKSETSVRTISIPSVLVDILGQHKDNNVQSEYVFTNANGGYIQPRNFNRAFDIICMQAIGRKIRVHDLRHTNATLMIAQNVSLKVIQSRLGHADIGTTMNIYSHVLKEVDKQAADAIETLLE